MSDLGEQERGAIEAVASYFSAPWEMGRGSKIAYIVVAGKRVAVRVIAIPPLIRGIAKPRLRFDKVALRLIETLQARLNDIVPEGHAAIWAITAPIRLASKTAAAMEDRIKDFLARRPAPREIKETIHGNQIRFRLVKSLFGPVSNVLGFVHNPDTDGSFFLDLAQSLLKHIPLPGDKTPPAKFVGDHWLVIAVGDKPTHRALYRHIIAQLSPDTRFKKMLLAFVGQRIESRKVLGEFSIIEFFPGTA